MDVFSVGRRGDENPTATASKIEQSQFRGVEPVISGKKPGCGNEGAIRLPSGPRQGIHGLGGNRVGIRAVDVRYPDIVATTAVTDVKEPLAIGAEARIAFHGRPTMNESRFAACRRQRVEVAQEIERERLPIGADIDAHPRSLGHGELRFDRGLTGVLDVPGIPCGPRRGSRYPECSNAGNPMASTNHGPLSAPPRFVPVDTVARLQPDAGQ